MEFFNILDYESSTVDLLVFLRRSEWACLGASRSSFLMPYNQWLKGEKITSHRFLAMSHFFRVIQTLEPG